MNERAKITASHFARQAIVYLLAATQVVAFGVATPACSGLPR